MDLTSFILLLNAAVIIIVGWLLRIYLPTYLTQKAKNLASKEDLTNLTNLVESVKAAHTSELERLKATLFAEGQVIERRRRVYEEICFALRVFIAGHEKKSEIKERFHLAYAAAWLWASDDVLAGLNYFIALQIKRAADPKSVDESTMKDAYTAIIDNMRVDVGLGGTVVARSSYQFVQFGCESPKAVGANEPLPICPTEN